MNHFYKFLATLVFLVGLTPSSQAQCPNDNSLYDILPAPSTIGASVGGGDCIFGGEYYRVTNMVAGNTYRISTCGAGTTFDTKITVYAQSGGASLAYNDDFCDLASELVFTPTVTGNYHILVDEWGFGDDCLDNIDCAELVITLIATPGGGGVYCEPIYTTGTEFGDFINGVQLGSINNQNSGIAEGPSFTYFNSLSTNLDQSANYTLTITNNPDFTESVAAWIDYNQNSIFDSSELLGEISILPEESGTINFTVPANALTGVTRLRVRMAWDETNINPCSSYSFGETEDYNINIQGGTPPPPSIPSCAVSVVPANGAQGVTVGSSISWEAGLGSPTFYQVYFGTSTTPPLVEANFTSTTYTPATLEPNTTYYFQIVPGNTQGLADGCLVFSFNTNETVVNSFNMTDGAVNACSGSFFDSGGLSSDYSSDEFFTFTISPDQPNSVVQVTFNTFETEEDFDELYVFDGDDLNAILIGNPLSGSINGPITFTGTTASGALTFVFLSDGSVNEAGWSASINCISTVALPECATNLQPANSATGVVINPTITWNAPSSVVTGYDVYFGTDATPPLVQSGVTGTSYTPANLLPNTTYYYQIVSINENGAAEDCQIVSFTTGQTLNVLMQNGTVNTCSANFFDTGGASASYSNDENFTLTITPSDANSKIQVAFNAFATENGFDFLKIYDGNSIAAPQIGPALGFTGTVSPGTVISTATDGSITFVFTSDNSAVAAGWNATVSCLSALELPDCATISGGPANGASDVCLNGNTFTWTAPASVVTGYEVYFGTPTAQLVGTQTGTSYVLPFLAPNTAYEFYVLSVNDNGVSANCDIQSFLTGDCVNYCVASGTLANCVGTNEFIANVQLGTINNSSVCSGYTDFTSISTNLTAGSTNPITITNGSTSWPTDQCAVYVDWNSDGDFDDAGETISPIVGSPGVGPYTASINVPADATGPKRMRVRINFGAAALACGITSFGEVEDYTLNILPATSGAPECVTYVAPANNATNVAVSGTVLSWEASASGGTPSSYDVYFGTDANPVLVASGVVGTTYNVGNLAINTTYYWQVIAINDDGVASECGVNTFSSQTNVIYCDASSNIANCVGNNEFIANVQIGSIDNPSACSGYTDFTSISTPVAIGLSYPITVTNGSVSWPTDQCAVWVDWNQDGDFTDAGEAVTPIAGSPGVGPYTGSINVPVGALTGPTRMRVRINFSAAPLPCGLTSFGEVEDYTLIVLEPTSGAPSCAVNLTPASGSVNVSNSVVLTWSSDINNGGTPTGYDVYFGTDANPPLVSANQPASSYNPGLLVPNTTYYWYVTPINNDGVAQDCQIFSFTTTGTINVNMQNGTIETCSANFFDSAGPNGNYTNNQNFTLTFTPSIPGNFIQVVFNSFNTEEDFDFLRIYDGNSIAAPQIGPVTGYTGANSPGIVTSTAADGSLTFVFTSDVSVTAAGWNAIVACLDPTAGPGCPVITSGPADGSTEVCTDDVVFTWSNPAGSINDGYFVFFGPEGNTEFVDFTEDNNLFSPGVLQPNTTYQLVLIPENSNGQNLTCDTITFTTGTCSQIGCVGIPAGSILEGEECGEDINGGCNSTPSAFGTIGCGETIYGNSFFDGATRDTDWYNFTVTEAGVFSVTVNSEFLGTVFFADATNCSNTVIIDQLDFIACDTVTLTAFFNPGVYTAIVVPSFTGPQINCTSGLNNYTISFNSASGQASIAPVAPVCITTTPFNLFAVPAGGTWSGTGITSAANGTFDPSIAGIGSFVITYTAPGDCNSTDQVTIIVGSGGVAPDAPTGPATVCAGQTTSTVSVNPVIGSSSYVWVLTPTSAGTITGSTETATINWDPSFVGTASVVVATQSACGLSPFSESLDVIVGATPNAPAAIEGSTTVCVLSSVYTTSGSEGAESYTWTISPVESGTIIGNGTNANVTWNTNYTGPVTISLTATNACGTSAATTINVTKLANPFADFVGLAATYCASEEPVELTGIPSGGTFAITTTTGDAASGIFGNIFNPNTAGVGTFNISYTAQIGQCIGQRVQEVTVLSAPTVSINALPNNVCSQSDNITLVGSPAGGVFSGTGVVGGVFNPSLAGAGVHTITYTVAGSGGGCDGVATVSVTVNPSPNVAISTIPSPLCLNSSPVLIVGTPAPGASFVNGTAASTVDPAALGVGTHIVRYEVDNGVCIGFAEQTITVTEVISASINGLPAAMCSNDTPVVLSSTPSGGIFSGNGVQGNIFDPKLAGVGIHTITCVVNQGACSAVVTQTVVVSPSPVAYFTYSTNGSTIVLSNISENATSYTWSFGDGNTSTLENPTHTYASNGSYVISLTANSASCGSSTFNLPLELSVGIGQIAGVEDVQLFPNPTLGLISLQFTSNRNQTFAIRVTDATGRLIEQDAITNYSGTYNKTYDLSSLARGMYFFTITSDNGAINYRVVKQ